MKVKALVNFSGLVTMTKGEEKDIDKDIAKDLLRAKFVEEIKVKKSATKKKVDKK